MRQQRRQTQWKLRNAKVSEAELLTALALRAKASNGYDSTFMAQCVEELTVDGGAIAAGDIWLGETEAGQIGGFVQFGTKDNAAIVEALFVEPEAQGSGLGRQLWQILQERAGQEQLPRIVVDSDPKAVPFYQAMGCRQIGDTPSDSIPGRYLPVLEKRLKS